MDKKIKKIDYLLMFLLVINSGSPLLLNNDFVVAVSWLLLFAISFVTFLFKVKDKKITKVYLYYLLLFIIIFTFHFVIFAYIAYSQVLGFFIKLLFSFLILKKLNEKFFILYVKIIVFFSIVSFVFYFPSVLFPSFKSLLYNIAISHPTTGFDDVKSLLFFNLNFGDNHTVGNYLRNSGPFWEPGAFAGYLLMALYFNTIRFNTFFNKTNIILLTALLTTLSTTGYIALIYFLIYFLFFFKTLKYRLIIIPFILIIGVFSFQTLPFLQEKLEKKIEKTENSDLRKDSRTRFASFIVDVKDLMTSPLVGRGISEQTRYIDFEENGISNRNNGDSQFLIKFGIIGFVFYFFSIYLTFRKYAFYNNQIKYKQIAIWGLLLVFLIGFSEGYFLQPFFIALSISTGVINYKFNTIKYKSVINVNR